MFSKIIVTAPRVFAFAFNIVKRFLNEYTLSKIEIYKNDPSKWKPAILKVIPKDQLPAHFGGSLTDPDGNPRLTTKVRNFVYLRFSMYSMIGEI